MAIWLFWKCSCECVNVTAEYRNTLLIRIVRFSYSSCVNSFRLAFVGFLFFLWANSEANRKERKPVRRTWEQQFKLKLSCVCVCESGRARTLHTLFSTPSPYSMCMRFGGLCEWRTFTAKSNFLSLSLVFFFLFIFAFYVSLPSCLVRV